VSVRKLDVQAPIMLIIMDLLSETSKSSYKTIIWKYFLLNSV